MESNNHGIMKRIALALLLTGAWLGGSAMPTMGQTNQKASTERIGVYDSRVIAYAHFWTDANMRKIKEMSEEAKANGQTERFTELSAKLKMEQERNHLQVFSTAPVDEVLAGMKERVAAVLKESGVSRLVSKWDEKTLKAYKSVQQVDVTDQLLREFKLNEKQLKVVADLRKQKPLPLDKAEELLRKGEL
jgi:hypothetical protein